MANNIKKLLPTDIISDSMDKINSNFDILSSYSVFSDKSLTEYYKKIDDLVNQISGKVDLSESRLNIEFEKIRGEIKDYNDDVSSINQTADMIQSTVSSLNKKFDGTVEKMQSQFTQTANNINFVVQSYRDENKADYDAINKVLDGFQDQIDGNIETWYYDGEPTLSNEPVITWIKDVANEEEKNKIYEKHQGDLYYDRTTGFAYRFFKNDDVYEWKLIRDYEITEMLGKINQKSKIFTSTPEPPYNVGDMWINTDKDLFICIRKRDSGIWSRDDWDYATRYKADLDDFKEKYQTDKTDFQNQIDGKVQYWFQENDPSIDWTTDDERKKHLNDLWYNTKQGITKVYVKTDSGYEWQETTDRNLENLAQSAKDGNITIFYGEYGEGNDDEGNPRVKPSGYKKGDLWYNCTYPTGTKLTDENNKYYHDTLRCQTTQGDSNFAIEHWVPIDGGDRPFSRISQDVDNINLEVYGSSEDGKDSLRTLINQRVTTGELEEAKTSITNKIDTDKSEILAKFDSYATNDKVNGVQSAVNELNAQINEGNSSIVSSLNLKAEKSELDKTNTALATLQTRVGTTETTLTQQATEIDDVKTSVGKLESAIGSGGSGSETSVTAALKVLTEKDKEHDSAISSLQSSVKQNGDDIASAKLDISANKNNITGLTSSIAEIKTTADNAASKLELKSVSDKANANETSISNLTTEIKGEDGKSGLKAGLENAVSRIGANETSISGLSAKIGDDSSGIISQINAQATDISGIKTTQTTMQSSIDDHTASIKTMVTKDEMNNAISSINIDADKININADHKLSIKSNGLFELISDNCIIDDEGNITAKNANISGNITTNSLTAETDTKKTEINGDKFEISTIGGDVSASISITIIDDMKNISGYGDAPSSLQEATNVPVLCMEYDGEKYYLWPGAWRTAGSGTNVDWSKTTLFDNGTYKSLNDYRLIDSISGLETILNNHLNTSVGYEDVDDIGLYFINSNAAYIQSGSNLEVRNKDFMCDLLTGIYTGGSKTSSPTTQSTQNFIPTYKKNSSIGGKDDVWTAVEDFYTKFKDGGYVNPDKQCSKITVQEAYDVIQSGNTQSQVNTSLGINALDEKYLLQTSNIRVSGVRIKPNEKYLKQSDTGSVGGLDVPTIVTLLIPDTATTDDEKTIKNFITNTNSTSEVTSYSNGGEFVVLSYPLYTVELGSIKSYQYVKYLYVLVSSGVYSLDESYSSESPWNGVSDYGDTNYTAATRTFYVSYLIDNDPQYDETGTALSETNANNKKKSILATLIKNLKNNPDGFMAKIPASGSGMYQEFANLTLFNCWGDL